jgi:hypothetical protein
MFGLNRPRPPTSLNAVLRPDEHLLAFAQDVAGSWLAATRYGVWKVPAGAEPHLFSWASISKARWQPPILQVTVADVVGELAGADLIVDRPPMNIEMTVAGKLTDIIHNRTLAGIISSVHHEFPGGGGWVVVRRVPGRDGVSVQVRLDAGTDPAAAQQRLAAVVSDALGGFSQLE